MVVLNNLLLDYVCNVNWNLVLDMLDINVVIWRFVLLLELSVYRLYVMVGVLLNGGLKFIFWEYGYLVVGLNLVWFIVFDIFVIKNKSFDFFFYILYFWFGEKYIFL